MEEGHMEAAINSAEETAWAQQGSILPFILLLASLAAGYWLWSSRSEGEATKGPTTPLPDVEELRRKRLEALQASMAAASKASEADEGLRRRSGKAAPQPTEAEALRQPCEPAVVQKPVSETEPVAAEPREPKREQSSRPKTDTVSAPETASSKAPKPSTIALRARGTLQGSSHLRNFEIQAESTVNHLQSQILKAFQPEASGCKVRVFFNGKELKNPTETVDSLGLSNNTCLQVMFCGAPTAQKDVAQSEKEPPKKEVPVPEAQPVSVRIQSTVQGHTSAYILKELSTCSRVLDLEALALGAFAPGEGLRPRLFFMGKELKDVDAFLGHVGLTPKAVATVQVMFSTGEPRAAAKTPSLGEAPAPPATASAAAGGTPSPPMQEGTNEAVLAAAAAAGCNVSALLGNSPEPAPGEGTTPAEAWRAMAGLEEQLSRESDMSEEPSVRQASAMLRHLLTTATHDNNPGLMQFAQSAIPDFQKIWSFEPTREHLKGLIATKAPVNQG
ncbi:unnamed protein product [Durusdinium trenchii]|uniref:Ubiquitin-like domain-containing protein n=1 Tax=Durusdinium trenchii TaxID=1381693 RepID=A0ABP0KX31_9DINO